MDYKFTANMEKELDDIADGTLNKLKVIKKFYEYISGCIGNLKPSDIKSNLEIILGNYNDSPIKLLNGKFGRYIVCGEKKFNLKQLIQLYKLNIQESEAETKTNCKLISDAITKSLENPIEPKKIQVETFKEWTKGKTKYILKNGTYGYFVEEIGGTGKKKGNYSMGYLIKKTADNNLIDDINENIDQILNLITLEDLESNIEYLKNKKSTKFKTKKNE